jgi:glycosyltransferase involved in cell wall biosynthesis
VKTIKEELAENVVLSGTPVTISREGFVKKILSQKLGHVELNPADKLPIVLERLTEVPGDGSPPLSSFWDETEHGLMAYVVERMELFKGKEEELTPVWVREFVWGFLSFSRQLRCDIMVYGNDRDSSNDAVIPALAEALAIPSISELLNLFVSKYNVCFFPLHVHKRLIASKIIGTVPTVIVGPSHYSIEHPTVHHANTTDNYSGFGRPKKADIRVISPGVDLKRFNPISFRGDNATFINQFHVLKKQSSFEDSLTLKPFVIGFVGRLSIEKNVGLFLMAAQLILKRCTHCRFTVVGDGALREKLELLCAQLEISWAVRFVGNDQVICDVKVSKIISKHATILICRLAT